MPRSLPSPGDADLLAIQMSLRSAIRAAAEQAGLSQTDLARRLGVPRSQVNAWLRDPRRLSLAASIRLLRAVDLRLDITILPAGRADVPPPKPRLEQE